MAAKEGWYRDPVAERWWDGSEWNALTRIAGEARPDGPIAAENIDQPAAWLPDPFTERYWDGNQWSEETRTKGSAPTPDASSVANQSATTSDPPTLPVTTTPSPTSRRYRTIALVAGAIAVIAIAVIVAAGLISGEDSSDTSDIEVPVGAVPVPSSAGYLKAVSGSPVTLSSASCGGLLAKIDATECIEASFEDELHALIFVDDGVEVFVSIFRISTLDAGIEAEQLLTGAVGSSDQLDTEISVRAYILGLLTGDAFALLVESVSGNSVTATLEFIGPTDDGQVATLGVYQGVGVDLAVDLDRVYVAMQRSGGDAQGGALVSTIYPARGGWLAVEEVVNDDQLSTLLSRREVVLFRSSIDGFVLSTTTTTTTSPPTTTTTPPTTTTIPSSGLIPGSAVSCDGSWIAIVSSQTLERTESAVSKFPGAYAVKNEDACASLNPTFSRGGDAGQPIYVVFYGPFFDRYDAQNQCLALGRTTMSQCYVAPLTNNPSDRSIRFGPTD